MFDVWLFLNLILWYFATDRIFRDKKTRGVLIGLFIFSATNLIGSLFFPILALLAVANIVVLKMWTNAFFK